MFNFFFAKCRVVHVYTQFIFCEQGPLMLLAQVDNLFFCNDFLGNGHENKLHELQLNKTFFVRQEISQAQTLDMKHA